MTWIKLDDNAVDHPKVASLSDRAFRWWVRGLSYASRFLTDGLLPPVFWKKVPENDRKELSGFGLWDWDDQNFLIHDYLAHQSSKDDVQAEKQRNRDKVAAFRERRRMDRRQDVTGNGNHGVTGNTVTPCYREVTDPENREQRTDTENRSKEPHAKRSDDRFDSWWSAYPKKTGKGAALKAWSKIRPSDAVVTQMLNALEWQRNQPQWLKDGGAFIPNPATYLNQSRWEDEPFFTTDSVNGQTINDQIDEWAKS
jgi:hypothetical protein